jgi:hypothetical protein
MDIKNFRSEARNNHRHRRSSKFNGSSFPFGEGPKPQHYAPAEKSCLLAVFRVAEGSNLIILAL